MTAMKKNVLLVEDEVILVLATKRVLEKAEYSVDTAPDGDTAVEKVFAQPDGFDLVLMDIDLGDGIDGTVAAERILAAVDLPVVFLSSHTEPEIVQRTEGITSYGYVVKSSSPTVLFASINMAFKLHAAKQSLVEAERAVVDERDTLRAIMHASPVGIMTVGPEMCIMSANPAAEDIAGRRLEDLGEPRCGDLLGCAHLHRHKSACGHTPQCPNCRLFADIQQTLTEGHAIHRQEADFLSISSDRTREMLLRYSTAPIQLNGRQAVLVNLEDITATQLEQHRMRLLSTIADSEGNIVIITDAERRTEWVNQGCINLTGYTQEELLGKNPGEVLQGTNPDQELKRQITDALNKGESYEGEILSYCKDGTPYWIQMHIHPVHNGQGRLTHFVAIEHNVTERRLFEERLA